MPIGPVGTQRHPTAVAGSTRPTELTPADPSSTPSSTPHQPSGEQQSGGGRAAVDADVQSDTRQRALRGDAAQQQRLAAVSGGVSAADRGPKLPADYGSLQKLSKTLPTLDPRFSSSSPNGRATMALALAIGGTEVYGAGTSGTDFFTRRGGTANTMRGFAQFNLAFHNRATSTPERYARLVGDIMNGEAPMPNSASPADHAAALTKAVRNGTVENGADLRRFMDDRGFGGSNWQGIDDGWDRGPGLGDALVQHVKDGLQI